MLTRGFWLPALRGAVQICLLHDCDFKYSRRNQQNNYYRPIQRKYSYMEDTGTRRQYFRTASVLLNDGCIQIISGVQQQVSNNEIPRMRLRIVRYV